MYNHIILIFQLLLRGGSTQGLGITMFSIFGRVEMFRGSRVQEQTICGARCRQGYCQLLPSVRVRVAHEPYLEGGYVGDSIGFYDNGY